MADGVVDVEAEHADSARRAPPVEVGRGRPDDRPLGLDLGERGLLGRARLLQLGLALRRPPSPAAGTRPACASSVLWAVSARLVTSSGPSPRPGSWPPDSTREAAAGNSSVLMATTPRRVDHVEPGAPSGRVRRHGLGAAWPGPSGGRPASAAGAGLASGRACAHRRRWCASRPPWRSGRAELGGRQGLAGGDPLAQGEGLAQGLGLAGVEDRPDAGMGAARAGRAWCRHCGVPRRLVVLRGRLRLRLQLERSTSYRRAEGAR